MILSIMELKFLKCYEAVHQGVCQIRDFREIKEKPGEMVALRKYPGKSGNSANARDN